MAQTPVDYVIFDLLHLDGRCVRDLPYVRRRELLAALGLDGPRWRTPRYRHGGGPEPARGGPPPGARGHRREAHRQPLPAGQAQRGVDQGARLAPPGVRDRRPHPGRGPARQSRRLAAGWLLREAALRALGERDANPALRRRRRLRPQRKATSTSLRVSSAGASAPRAPSRSAPRRVRRPGSRSGASRSLSARSPGPSGPTRGPCASPPSRVCATTRTRARWCGSCEHTMSLRRTAGLIGMGRKLAPGSGNPPRGNLSVVEGPGSR